MVKMTLNDIKVPLTDDELRELDEAAKKTPVFDSDSPEMTTEQLIQFKRMHHEDRTKQTVSLRLSQSTLRKARAYGKGYTAFLSRLLDEAIDDEELVRKCV
jgi:hypothetical protein